MKPLTSESRAACITKSASKQSYYTIRFFADRARVGNAYRAYGYLRWVDDVVDVQAGSASETLAFVHRQKSLLQTCYCGETPHDLQPEEAMLADLISSDPEKSSGLQIYLCNMLDIMAFDAKRRGAVLAQADLSDYTRKLAMAVTEALYYFIGHDEPQPLNPARYLAVTAAHITHMLRDTYEDTEIGYFNIPKEYLQTHGIAPEDVTSEPYREWVCGRVHLARKYFAAGREYFSHDPVLRRRLAGYAYTARFEWVLGAIERDNYCLRSEYPERKGLGAGLWMGGRTLTSALAFTGSNSKPRQSVAEPVHTTKQ